MTRNSKRAVHPIRHLLLINYLENDISTFFSNVKSQYSPFGLGPWPCLNKIASHYRRNVIKNLKITWDYKAREPVGTFSCDCGFAYSRKGPDKSIEDKYKIERIKSFGHVWEKKLECYLKEKKYGLRELARLMYCDPKTILKFDDTLGIHYFKPKAQKVRTKNIQCIENHLMESYKKSILDTIAAYPDAAKTDIRDRCRKEYSYLFKKDKEWLSNNLPESRKNKRVISKVDWNKRDREFLKLIAAKYSELTKSEPPRRITISSIGRELNIISELENNLDKLPETKKYLVDIAESVQEFQIRRCNIIIQRKKEAGEQIRLWEIQRIVGIRTAAFKKIIHYINTKDGGK